MLEEIMTYGDEIQFAIEELLDEINMLYMQRENLLGQLDNELVDKVDMMARLQAIDALLSVNHGTLSDMYAELKFVDAEIGYAFAEPEQEEGLLN